MSISAVMSDLEAVGGEGSGQGTSSKATEEVTLTAADIPGLSCRSRWTNTLLLLCVGGCSVEGQRFQHQ